MRHWSLPKRLSTSALFIATTISMLLTPALSGCGGVDSGGTGQTVERPTASSGRITGFGSVVVNGIRYDDDQATVVDDDGVSRPRADLRLGMVVEVLGRVRGNSGEGTASRIQFGPEIAGPVESIDVPGSRLTVLGQTVRVDADTFFGGFSGSLSAVHVGYLVQVHGFFDAASGSYTATRVDRSTTLAQYVLRGPISNHAGPPARTFAIGAAGINYGAVAQGSLPTLANGNLVRVKLNTAPVAGRWVATSVHSAERELPDDVDANVEGHVAGFVSPANFRVRNVRVDASGSDVEFRHGTLGDLRNGQTVEIEGHMRDGVLVATVIEFERSREDRIELSGVIETLDTGTRTLTVRGVAVLWNNDTRFSAGRESDLRVGVTVVVRGSAQETRVLAESVRFGR